MNDSIRRAKALILVSLALLLPGTASATTFSFGTIESTDVITSIIIAPSAGDTAYTAGTDSLVIDAYISTINFANRAPIAITPGDVTFSSQLTMSNELLLGPQFAIAVVTGQLSNGMTDDFSITDIAGGLSVLGGDFDAPMEFAASTVTGTVSATLAADIGNFVNGDADFISALGTNGSIDIKVVLGTGDICSTIATCPPVPFQTPGAVLHDFAGATNGTIIPVVIPEPGTAMLLGLGILGLTLRARETRIRV